MEEKNKNGLTKEQAYDVVAFASALTNGFYTPHLNNYNLVSLTGNTKTPDYDKVIKALDKARECAKDLQEYSAWVEYNDMLYARLIRYYANMLSFDLKVTCINASGDDYRSKEYLDDKKRVWKFLDNFDCKREFSRVIDICARQQADFTWLRTTRGTFSQDVEDVSAEKVTKLPKYTLQTMPQDYCLLTGYFEQGGLYDFDMSYFLQAGVDIDAFDPIFKKKAREIFDENSMVDYVPTNPLNRRNGTFSYWVQTSPEQGAWVFLLDEFKFDTVPFLAPALPNMITDREMQALQKDKDIEAAYGLLVGEMEMLDKQKSGNIKDAFAVNPKTLGKLLNLVRSGLDKHIKVGALPVRNLDFYQYEDKNPDTYSNQVTNTSSISASAGNMLFSTSKMSQEEVRNAIINDSNIIKRMYSQFNAFLNFYVNKKTRKYKFSFEFEGINFPFEQEYRQKKVMELANVGIVLPSAIGAAYGYKPQDFERMMEEAKYGGFTDNLVQLMSIHTASDKAGRPKQDEVKTDAREYDDTE